MKPTLRVRGVGQQIVVHFPVGRTRRASWTQPRSADGSIVADALLAWRCGHGGAYTGGRQSRIDQHIDLIPMALGGALGGFYRAAATVELVPLALAVV